MLTTNVAFAKMHEFETTHMKSMGGAAAAGMFMEEASFLNPASLSFFKMGDAYFQRDMMEIKNEKGEVIQKPKSTAAAISDSNESVSGSASYVHQEEGNMKRSRWGATSSAAMGESSALGVSVRKTKDENTTTNQSVDYYQTVIGVTHFIDQQSSFGIIAYDLFKSKGDETKAIIGFQHIFADAVTMAFDAGGDYNSDEISRTLFYRGGLQFRVLNDFYIRIGAFKDKTRAEKGTSYGLSWVQPKLAFEFAIKNTKQEASTVMARTESKIKDMSFGVSFRF